MGTLPLATSFLPVLLLPLVVLQPHPPTCWSPTQFRLEAIAHVVLFYCCVLTAAYFIVRSFLYLMARLNYYIVRETLLTILSIEIFLQFFLVTSSSMVILCLLSHRLSAPTITEVLWLVEGHHEHLHMLYTVWRCLAEVGECANI